MSIRDVGAAKQDFQMGSSPVFVDRQQVKCTRCASYCESEIIGQGKWGTALISLIKTGARSATIATTTIQTTRVRRPIGHSETGGVPVIAYCESIEVIDSCPVPV